MKRFMLLIVVGIIFFSSLVLANECITSMQQAKDLAIKEGKDQIETIKVIDPSGNVVNLDFPYKIFRKGGIGEGGFWTFYTIKYYSTVEAIVVVVYKPAFGSIIILRQDRLSIDDFVYTCIIEQDHSTVIWSFFNIGKETVDGMTAMLLKPMKDLINNPNWGFTPDEEMRPDLCWEIKALE